MKLRAARTKPMMSIEGLLPSFDESGKHMGRVSTWDQSPLDRMHATELRVRVRECIAMLPIPYRVVLLLCDIEQLDTQEVAERLRISPGAVKIRLHRGRQALRTLLDPIVRSLDECACGASRSSPVVSDANEFGSGY